MPRAAWRTYEQGDVHMIRINLLPNHLRPVKRTLLPHMLSMLVLAGALFWLGSMFMAERGELARVNGKYEAQDRELKGLEAVIKEHNELTSTKLQLQDKIETIQTILADRSLWSEWLHQLTILTPDNIWYTKIRLTSRRFSEERIKMDKQGKPELNPRTKEPVIERVQVQRPVLEVSGYAIEDASGEKNTAKLADATNSDPKFSEKFKLFTAKTVDTEYNGYSVRSFTFEYVI